MELELTPREFSGDNGPATSAKIGEVHDLAIDDAGDLYMADHWNHCIRKIVKTTEIITTVAGICGRLNNGYLGDNVLATTTNLTFPTGVAVNSNGEIVVADKDNNRIRLQLMASYTRLQETAFKDFRVIMVLPSIPRCTIQVPSQ